MNDDLVRLSMFAGLRFDLIQAGGGNSSLKIDENQMLVKSSGINLSQVTAFEGFVTIDYRKIRENLHNTNYENLDKKQCEKIAENLTQKAMLSHNGRASIETFLHALLNTHTLHTHPITVNIIAAQNNWRDVFQHLFPGCACVKYATPGIGLAVALCEVMQEVESGTKGFPEIIFLQNHGLIVSSTSVERVEMLTNEIVVKLEKFLNIDMQRYRDVEPLRGMFVRAGYDNSFPFLTDDSQILREFNKESQSQDVWPFCPDTLIYCQVRPVYLRDIKDYSSLRKYISKFHDAPKVVIVDTNVYCVGSSLRKAKEIEELFKFHLMVVAQTGTDINRLALDEVAYLNHWDAEKYRQEL